MGVEWRGWGKEAFVEAKANLKPILLHLTVKWCHSCHLMDKTVYSDPGLVRLINERFIPIRVDADERPDIDRIYNLGGWPSTLALTHEGHVISGSLATQPHRLREILENAINNPNPKPLDNIPQVARHSAQPSRRILDELVDLTRRDFDEEFGGFGTGVKFPAYDVLDFMLLEYEFRKDPSLGRIVEKTLEAIENGPLHDRLMGGFYRYSQTRDWRSPHKEKLCVDNARLAGTFLRAHDALEEPVFKDAAVETMEFLESTMILENGSFANAVDAEDGEVDTSVYTDVNAVACSSLAKASRPLERDELVRRAVKALDNLLARNYSPGVGMLHQQNRGEPILLRDQVLTTTALLDMHDLTAAEEFLNAAEELTDLSMESFRLAEGGLKEFAGGKASFLPKGDRVPIAENSLAVENLLRLYVHRPSGVGYWNLANEIIIRFSGTWTEYGLGAARYGVALRRFFSTIGPDKSITW